MSFLAATGAFFSSLRGEDERTNRFSGAVGAALATGLAACLGGETVFLDAALPEDTTALTFFSGICHHLGATETDRVGLLEEGATVALLLTLAALVTLVSALRAAFSSLLRMGAATLATLLPLFLSAEGFGASFFFTTVTLRLTLGGLAIFLSFESDLGAFFAGLTVLAGETDFLTGDADLALDWLLLALFAGVGAFFSGLAAGLGAVSFLAGSSFFATVFF